MKRRTILIGFGATAAGGAVAGTGAFDLIAADRTASINVADESQALLSIEPVDEDYASTVEQGQIRLNFDGGNTDDVDGEGFGQNSVYTFDDVFKITNRGTREVGVAAVVRTDSYPEGIEEFSLYSTDEDQDFGNQAESDETVEGDELTAVPLSPGDSTPVGVRVETGAPDSGVDDDASSGNIIVDIRAEVGIDGLERSGVNPRISTVERESESRRSPEGVARRGEMVEVTVGLEDVIGISGLTIDARDFGAGTIDVDSPGDSVTKLFEVDGSEDGDGLGNQEGGDKRVTVELDDGRSVESESLYVPNIYEVDGGSISDTKEKLNENDVIHVASGRYAESLTIEQPLFLEGPNEGTDAVDARPRNGGRADEALIVPPGPDPTRDALIKVEASDVFIDGFTLSGFDGFASALEGIASQSAMNGIDPSAIGADFGVQIESNSDPSGVEVRNNVVRAFGSYGVLGRNGTDATVENNLVADMPGVFGRIEDGEGPPPDPSLRTGVRFVESSATVRDNTMTRVFVGVSAQANGGKQTLTAEDNFIESERVGVRAFQQSVDAVIDGNYLDTFRPESFQNAGIWAQSANDVDIVDNRIANSFSGVEVFDTEDVTITGTRIDRCLRGIYAYNYADFTRAPTQMGAAEAATATIGTEGGNPGDGPEIRNCGIGILADDRQQGSDPVTLTVNDATVYEPGIPSGINDNGRFAANENVEDAVARGSNATIVDNDDDLSTETIDGGSEE